MELWVSNKEARDLLFFPLSGCSMQDRFFFVNLHRYFTDQRDLNGRK